MLSALDSVSLECWIRTNRGAFLLADMISDGDDGESARAVRDKVGSSNSAKIVVITRVTVQHMYVVLSVCKVESPAHAHLHWREFLLPLRICGV